MRISLCQKGGSLHCGARPARFAGRKNRHIGVAGTHAKWVFLTEGFSKINRASFRQRGNLFVQDDPVGERNVETKTRVFISYSRKDMAFADKLEAALRARGFEVLIDREEIYAFEDWWTRIEALIGGADTVVFVISPEAVKSDVAVKEVAHAASLNKRFAPTVCRRVENSAVPEALRRLNFIFFRCRSSISVGTTPSSMRRGSA